MWRPVDTTAYTIQDTARDQSLIWRLRGTINASLNAYRIQSTEETSGEIEDLLSSYASLHKGSWHQMKGCHKDEANHTPPPTRVIFEFITVERVTMYHQVPPPGENIPISIETFQVQDYVSAEDNIEWAVWSLRTNRSVDPSGMKV